MGQEHEELIRRVYEHINAWDVEGGMHLSDPEIELRTRFTGVTGRPYRGFEGVRQWFADVGETLEEVEQVPKRFIEIDQERTIVVTDFHGRGRGSGLVIEQEIASIFTIRDGKVVSVETHPSVEETLAAAGLSEESPG
jgi:ketosteroid isomerase-like protein